MFSRVILKSFQGHFLSYLRTETPGKITKASFNLSLRKARFEGFWGRASLPSLQVRSLQVMSSLLILQEKSICLQSPAIHTACRQSIQISIIYCEHICIHHWHLSHNARHTLSHGWVMCTQGPVEQEQVCLRAAIQCSVLHSGFTIQGKPSGIHLTAKD